MTTTDLAAFLTICLDEDQREAEEALRRTTTTRRMIGGRMVEDTVQPPEWRRSAWTPARVLAEVEAKRKIMEQHGDQHECSDQRGAEHPYAGCATLRLLALPYADRPGYREEWRP